LNLMEKTIEKIDATLPAEQRSLIYGLLSEVYMNEVSKDLLEQIKASGLLGIISESDSHEMDHYFQGDVNKLLEELACEYSRLFIGPGKHISPHESVHHQLDGGDWGKLWGASTVAVQNFVKSAGMTYQEEFKGVPDHIAVEFEFMKQLTIQEKEAREGNDNEQLVYFLSIEKKFLHEHIGTWIPTFCDKVLEIVEHPFYKEIVLLTKAFIEFEINRP
jgi:TorA maturation chaperone TorD